MSKRSVNISGHQTSITLEDEFWVELKTLAQAQGLSINALISKIDKARAPAQNLSSAARLYVLKMLKDASS